MQLQVQRGSEAAISMSSQDSQGQQPRGGKSRGFKYKPHSSYFLTLLITGLRSKNKSLIWIPFFLISDSQYPVTDRVSDCRCICDTYAGTAMVLKGHVDRPPRGSNRGTLQLLNVEKAEERETELPKTRL